MADGATVSVYVAGPLCAAAQRQLAKEHGRAGAVRVRAVCLPAVLTDSGLDLAQVGANARRATEDSASVAYLEPPGRANRFSTPILEAAGIASITTSSGSIAMAEALDAIAEADSSSLRDSVSDSLSG